MKFLITLPLLLTACTQQTFPITCDEMRYAAIEGHGKPDIHEVIQNDDGTVANVWSYYDHGSYTFNYSEDSTVCSWSRFVFDESLTKERT